MTTLKFKTNINCKHCIAKITPFLDELNSIGKWEVDTNSPDKILSVQGDDITADEIQNVLKRAGYNSSIYI